MTTKKSESDPNEPPEVRLRRFLHIGKEYPEYQPGNWFVHNYYSIEHVPSIQELAANKETETKPVEIIEEINKEFVKREFLKDTLIFALALCARQNSEKLKHAAYSKIKEICISPEDFLLFIKFANEIVKKQGKKHGWGRGWKKAVEEWYDSQGNMNLAIAVTRCKSRYGWKHKDILKLSHVTTSVKDKFQLETISEKDLVKNIVFTYVMNGLKEVEKNYGSADDEIFEKFPDASAILNYLTSVEDFKHCEDEITAGKLVNINNFVLDHVPGHLLKSAEVWESLILTMNSSKLLDNLQRIHNLGFLCRNKGIINKVTDKLSESVIKQENIYPAHIFITIRNYEHSGKPLSYEKRKVREEAKKQHPEPPKPNQKIIEALYKALNWSFENQEATGKRYMITINMSPEMHSSKVWQCGNLNTSEAGCLIALCLLRREENVTIASFKDVGIHTLNLEKNSTFGQAYRRMQQMPTTNSVNLGKPMSWAIHQKKKFDVFINVIDKIHAKDESESGIKAYRMKMNLPNTKLITCVMCDSTTNRKGRVDKNNLYICGFDKNVPKIIDAFSKSNF